MTRYIKAEQGLHHSVIYTTDDGKYFRYFGGTWPWRNNNPGNLNSGSVSKRHNQIGVAGGFAIFPNRETGHDALLDCLISTYGNSSIDQMIESYAPPKVNVHFPAYRKDLHDKTGVKDNKKIKDFSPEQFEALWRTVEKWEGYDKEGTIITRKIVEMSKISHVHKDKNGAISGYCIDGQRWVSKVGFKRRSS